MQSNSWWDTSCAVMKTERKFLLQSFSEMFHRKKSMEETDLLLWRESENKLKLLGKVTYFSPWPVWKESGSNSYTPAGEGLQQCFGAEFAPRDKLRPLILVWCLVTWMKQILGLIPSPHKHLQKHCSNCVGHNNSLQMLKHQIPVIFLNEKNTAQLLCHSKKDDVQHMVKVTLNIKVPSQIN